MTRLETIQKAISVIDGTIKLHESREWERVILVFKDGVYKGELSTASVASARTGVSPKHISEIMDGKRESYNGYRFEFEYREKVQEVN